MRFLFVDQILSFISDKEAIGLKHITSDDFYLTQEEASGAWAFIPSLMGETLGQLAAWHVMAQCQFRCRPVAGIAASATFYKPAYIGQTLCLHTVIDTLDETAVQYHGEITVDNECVFSLEGALGPLLPMEQFIATDTVKAQFAEIYRPSVEQVEKEKPPVALIEDAAMDLMTFDQVIRYDAGIGLLAEKKVFQTAPYFADHFPHKPVLPMTVLLESFIRLVSFFIKMEQWSEQYVCHQIRRAKMSDFISPGDLVVGEVKIKTKTEDQCIFLCRAEVSGKRVAVFELLMNVVRSA